MNSSTPNHTFVLKAEFNWNSMATFLCFLKRYSGNILRTHAYMEMQLSAPIELHVTWNCFSKFSCINVATQNYVLNSHEKTQI